MKRKKLPFNLILLGMVASGKDTQAILLLKHYIFETVESGNYWRSLLTANTKEGRAIRKTTAKGLPAPVSLMKSFLKEKLKEKKKNVPLLFLGNPRLLPEAKLLVKMLRQKQERFFALYISLPEREVFRRVGNRGRFEDERRILKNRVVWHKSMVLETVSYFEGLGRLKRIDGNEAISKVQSDIREAIKEFAKREY